MISDRPQGVVNDLVRMKKKKTTHNLVLKIIAIVSQSIFSLYFIPTTTGIVSEYYIQTLTHKHLKKESENRAAMAKMR